MVMLLEGKELKKSDSSAEANPPIRAWRGPGLANSKRQRRLLEIQQQVADEQIALEVAWNRLAATTSKDYSPTIDPVAKDSVNAQYRGLAAPMQNGDSKAGIIQAPNNTLPAPSEQAVSPSFRAPQLNLSLVKNENTDSNGAADPNLERLRELAAATRSASSPSQAPPVPNVPVYHGRALGEFKNYAMRLECHFNRYLDWYNTDERKVTRALKHVALTLEDKWKRQIRERPSEQVTFGGFCTFLIHQLQNGVYPKVAKARYINSYQRPSQSVTDFSNWLQQWEPHFDNDFSERDRMRHLFEHLSNRVRDEADKTYLEFIHYYDFVIYLQRVEDSIDKRAGPLDKKFSNPRKRPRTHS
ncbi:hypothetical protein N7499_003610 [Penicillium canescens]|uniref:Uncharacterized protein n=1 Tax=Penicillium canescens TaxID=5083 RepID=A0AAD6N7J4_PENCN|nr:uncharacterized protein N7446_012560 [Penicillium canescens]KAJ6038750.1 hypothetical protein N7460_007467 [Penicillium canescens]KAJ6045696.1 hypothetical protein N7446_012560 [Penicillium canescens]KAJ6066289.1 hypothetical protein N7444_000042 [Penicillium canescens]KAJ6090896.1 hypothetical protein N7499_003610 [Penicillium canescens]KAJ6175106.1 hypothetical protein N7485_004911 [Penicillium canescens]